MTLYIISKNKIIQKRWSVILSSFHPIFRESLPSSLGGDTMVMIHDNVLCQLNDIQKKNLFALHVMVLSTTPTFEQARSVLALGAKGYGNTMMHESYLVSACQAIQEGNIWLSPEYINQMIQELPTMPKKETNPLEPLSHREVEVAILLSQGDSHKEIAQKLDITVRTVKAHATAIYSRLNIKDRLALALLLRN
ncbi:helix-turn-helix transcriptional regulator [Sulfurospirillum oryzae]|uniref:helix-turn-helix transcriptional regulator n=1 Tax=Sulfurospirillum oryzae TaxID=2976535 RepID=UPI0021E96E7D|nr:response regulator transcription factor [Sulfurospirillum oryzae]